MLTSEERVINAINYKVTDRIPVDLGGHRVSGIMVIANNRFKKHLGIFSGDIYGYDFVKQHAIIEEEVLDLFGIDTIDWVR